MTTHTTSPETDNSHPTAVNWATIGRILLKASLLFVALNLLFAAAQPLDFLGGLSLYNTLLPGRARLPYGEVPSQDYNLTLSNIPAMLASHAWSTPTTEDEFRVLLLGDSGTWGWFLENDYTLAGQLNALGLTSEDGRRVVVYNLGYPVMSLTKDLVLLDAALDVSEADLVLWPVTLQSFARGRQLDHPLLRENAGRLRELIGAHRLDLDPADPRFAERTFVGETIVGRRRELADLLRLQGWGVAWAATERDQAIPDDIPLRQSDFDPDESWLDVAAPRPLTEEDLTLDVLRAGVARAGDVPVLLVNEPIFISDGENSDLRYNAFYPRWAYDQYRELLAGAAEASGWAYLDLWDAIPPDEFTDTPVHLTPEGTRLMAERLAGPIGDLGR